MHNSKSYISLFFLLCSAFCSQAQFSFLGSCVEEGNSKPLAGVEVFHHQSNSLKYSDERGVFEFSNLAEGVHHFTLFAENYQSQTDTINLSKNTESSYVLKPWNLKLDAIQVIAEREEFFAIKALEDIEETSIYAGKKSEVINIDQIKGNLASSSGRQVYAQVTGLNIYEGNDGGLQLNIGGRGLDPNRSANFNTRQNGYDISADVLGYPENYYTPPTEAIDEIRILRGASSLQYGTQFGGLIDFRLHKTPYYKKLEVKSSQTYGSFNTFNSFNYLGFSKGKWSGSFFYNFKNGDGYRANSEYRAHNFFAAIDHRFSQKTSIGFEFSYYTYLAKQAGGLTDTQFLENPRQSTRDRNWFEIDWRLYNLKFKHDFNPRSALTFQVFGLDASRNSVGFRGNPIRLNENPITALDEQNLNGDYILERDLIRGQFQNYGSELKFLQKYKLMDTSSVFLIGAKFYKSNNLSIQGPGSLDSDADFNLYDQDFPAYANQSNFHFPNTNVSFFSENIFYLNRRLSIIPGVRFEHILTRGDGNYQKIFFDNAGNPIDIEVIDEERRLERNFVLLGLGVAFQQNKNLQWIANFSQNYRSVTFNDIRVVSPTFIVDENITDERGFTADFGVRGSFDKNLSYSLNLYSILYNDKIGVILDDNADRIRKNIGQAFITGTEALVNVHLSRWLFSETTNHSLSLFLNSAFTYSQYLSSEENNVAGKKVEFIPRSNVKLGCTYGFKKFEISYQWTALSEQFTDAQNSPAASAGDKREGIIGPIPSYAIADLNLSYDLGKFTLKTGVSNLLNKSYYTRRATGYPGPGIIPSEGRGFFVSLGYNYSAP